MTFISSPQIIFLGTGSAFPTHSYNACYVLSDKGFNLLVDAGGGNEIIKLFGKAHLNIVDISHFFVTHSHTDHILGAPWIIRSFINAHIANTLTHKLTLLGNTETLEALDTICRLTLLPAHYEMMHEIVNAVNIERQPEVKIGEDRFRFFDAVSRNVTQSGFECTLSNGRRLVALGDESITPRNIDYCRGADYVICGAFCCHADAERFRPYEKHHHTVRDVAVLANDACVKTIVLVHCEDTDLGNRENKYRLEASQHFPGAVIVPTDLSTIKL